MTHDWLRVGIIGIGWYASQVHVPDLRSTGRAEVTAISRRNPERLRRVQRAFGIPQAYTDWREMLDHERLDAVVISTPHHAHVEPTLAALERGLHVLVEKPLALAHADAQMMVEVAERQGRVLTVGYGSRFRGAWRTAKRYIEEGALGTVRQANIVYGTGGDWLWTHADVPEDWQNALRALPAGEALLEEIVMGRHWRTDPAQMGGGMFADVGSHAVDVLLWLAGAGPREVVGFCQAAGSEVDTDVTAQARLTNGVLASIVYGNSVVGGPGGAFGRGRLTILADRGVLEADWQGLNPLDATIQVTHDGLTEILPAAMPDLTPAAAWVGAILDGAPNLAPGHEAARAVALIEAVYRSSAEGRIIQVEPPRPRV